MKTMPEALIELTSGGHVHRQPKEAFEDHTRAGLGSPRPEGNSRDCLPIALGTEPSRRALEVTLEIEPNGRPAEAGAAV